MKEYKCTTKDFINGFAMTMDEDGYGVTCKDISQQIEEYINDMSQKGYVLINVVHLNASTHLNVPQPHDSTQHKLCFIWSSEDVFEE